MMIYKVIICDLIEIFKTIIAQFLYNKAIILSLINRCSTMFEAVRWILQCGVSKVKNFTKRYLNETKRIWNHKYNLKIRIGCA